MCSFWSAVWKLLSEQDRFLSNDIAICTPEETIKSYIGRFLRQKYFSYILNSLAFIVTEEQLGNFSIKNPAFAVLHTWLLPIRLPA
jgi:hypothetical protein